MLVLNAPLILAVNLVLLHQAALSVAIITSRMELHAHNVLIPPNVRLVLVHQPVPSVSLVGSSKVEHAKIVQLRPMLNVLLVLTLPELVPHVILDTMCLVALVLNATLILPMLVVQLVPPKELIPHVRPIIT